MIFKHTLKMLSFIGVQYVLGKRGSFPYGLLMGFSLVKIMLLVIISDIIQTYTLLHFMDSLLTKIPMLRKLKEKWEHRRQSKPKREKPSLWDKLKQKGDWGLLALAALPYGGGALTGSIVALSLGMDKGKAKLIVISGCVIGTLIFYFGFECLRRVSDGSLL